MKWTVVARVMAAAIGLGCAAAIFVYTRNRPQSPKPVTSLADVDKNTATAGGVGQSHYLRVGRSPIKLSYEAIRTYDDGRTRLEKAKIEGLEETRYTINCDVLETQGKSGDANQPARFSCAGHVVLTTDDGLRLESETASYDVATELLTIPGPVTFVKGRLSGSGVGAAYDRDHDAFTILDQATAHVQADATGKGSADATARQMTLVRGQHLLLLDGAARIVGEAQTLTGDKASIGFTEDESAIKYLELRGTARVTPNPGAAAERPGMSADNVTMTFQPDGLTLQHATLTGRAVLTLSGPNSRTISASWIDVFVGADGRTLTGLQARDSVTVNLPATATGPGRRITATSLNATGAEAKGLTSARFEGNPRFEERPAVGPRRGGPAPSATPERTGSATTLELTLGGQLDAIERADFLQKAEFRDGTTTGVGDIAQYHEAKGLLRLMPNPKEPRRGSVVTTPDISVDAGAIDMHTDTQNLEARGNVRTKAKATGTAKAASGATLFNGVDPISGAAEAFDYKKDGGLGTYKGSVRAPAKLWQGETSVTASQIVFTETSRDLTADGSVESTWQLAERGSATLKSYSVRADSFRYVEARRNAVYQGSLVTLTTPDAHTIESRRLTLQLAPTARTLSSLHAERMDGPRVYVKLTAGSEGVGDDLVYREADETYTLKGKSAYVRTPKNEPGTTSAGEADCNLQESLVFEFNRRTGESKIPGKGEAPRTMSSVFCSENLRSIKK